MSLPTRKTRNIIRETDTLIFTFFLTKLIFTIITNIRVNFSECVVVPANCPAYFLRVNK
jgi:hypothetical protein